MKTGNFFIICPTKGKFRYRLNIIIIIYILSTINFQTSKLILNNIINNTQQNLGKLSRSDTGLRNTRF